MTTPVSAILDPSDVTGYGLIFVSKVDPLAEIVQTVTAQRYDSVGFYYQSTLYGTPKTMVLLMDVIAGPSLPGLDTIGKTLEDVAANPLVRNIALKPLRYEDDTLRNNFLLEIANIVRPGAVIDVERFVRALFGSPVSDSPATGYNLTGIEMVNRVASELSMSITPKWTILNQTEMVTSIISQADVIAREFFWFIQQPVDDPSMGNIPVQSYLLDDTNFEPWIAVNTEDFTPAERAEAVSAWLSIPSNLAFVKAVMTKFTDLVATDPDFYNLVREGMKFNMRNVAVGRALVQERREATEASSNAVIEALRSGIETNNMDYTGSAGLKLLVDNYITQLQANNLLYGTSNDVPAPLPALTSDTTITLHTSMTLGLRSSAINHLDKFSAATASLNESVNKIRVALASGQDTASVSINLKHVIALQNMLADQLASSYGISAPKVDIDLSGVSFPVTIVNSGDESAASSSVAPVVRSALLVDNADLKHVPLDLLMEIQKNLDLQRDRLDDKSKKISANVAKEIASRVKV